MNAQDRAAVRRTLMAIRCMGLMARYSEDYGEYRVNIPAACGGTEATAYYTPDSDDAIGTGKAMNSALADSTRKSTESTSL